jgi:hypothetical protein
MIQNCRTQAYEVTVAKDIDKLALIDCQRSALGNNFAEACTSTGV